MCKLHLFECLILEFSPESQILHMTVAGQAHAVLPTETHGQNIHFFS